MPHNSVLHATPKTAFLKLPQNIATITNIFDNLFPNNTINKINIALIIIPKDNILLKFEFLYFEILRF